MRHGCADTLGRGEVHVLCLLSILLHSTQPLTALLPAYLPADAPAELCCWADGSA
jgi:adenylate cyclase